MNIILFGSPYSGKGTQASLISEKYDLIHLNTGELLRKEVQTGSKLGKKYSYYLERGEIVPNHMVSNMINNMIKKHITSKGFIFDGFPRSVEQAHTFESILNENDLELNLCIGLKVSDDIIMERAIIRSSESNRIDDTNELINKRLNVHKEIVEPVADFYKVKGLYKEINGNLYMNDVFDLIVKEIDIL